MSAGTRPCRRCGAPTPTIDNIAETTFWGKLQGRVRTTTTVQSVRLRMGWIGLRPRLGGPTTLQADEEQDLCSGCWSLLVGRFLQGRAVPALPGKEDRR